LGESRKNATRQIAFQSLTLIKRQSNVWNRPPAALFSPHRAEPQARLANFWEAVSQPKHSAELASGETVLILGATGLTGKLAVQIAKILGAGRVVAAGRNERVLSTPLEIGADATIRLDKPDQELIEAFRREAGEKGFDVIIDYLWGPPTEALLTAITGAEFAVAGSEARLVEVGESARPTITLPAAVLRSTALTIL
jgi:NADPH:quinone reductase-like Zn-dependent oxidoreductase